MCDMTLGLKVLAAGLVICSLSCSWLVKPAEVELVGLAFPGESIVDLSVKIKNPNSFSAKASNIEYAISIGSEVVGRGRSTEVLSLGAGDSLVAHLPLSYDALALLRVLPQLANDTTVCRIEGTYRLEVLVLRPRMRFAAERRVALKDRLREVAGAASGDGSQ
ncbi:MAG: LEA type 2 family protein [Armatimonadetes bacterium]|nr:LEA type 2 family protein [Armatimonadota bacterium]